MLHSYTDNKCCSTFIVCTDSDVDTYDKLCIFMLSQLTVVILDVAVSNSVKSNVPKHDPESPWLCHAGE